MELVASNAANTGRALAPGAIVLRRRGLPAVLAVTVLMVGLLVIAPAALSRPTASLALEVTFNATGTISVTLPDGTPIGTTSGAPTVIPAGYYSLQLSGPGGCAQLPLFYLQGPGENLNDDMSGGEVNTEIYSAYFPPNSTYTWRTDRGPSAVVHTFVTSATVQGTPAAGSGTPGSTGFTPTVASGDIVGSAVVPFRGTLTGTVSSTGGLTLAFEGKSVANLTAGRYRVSISDRSATSGFTLERANHAPLKLTGVPFVGSRSVSVDLTTGRWLYAAGTLGKKTHPVVVH